jgi:hypothetical protein
MANIPRPIQLVCVACYLSPVISFSLTSTSSIHCCICLKSLIFHVHNRKIAAYIQVSMLRVLTHPFSLSGYGFVWHIWQSAVAQTGIELKFNLSSPFSRSIYSNNNDHLPITCQTFCEIRSGSQCRKVILPVTLSSVC